MKPFILISIALALTGCKPNAGRYEIKTGEYQAQTIKFNDERQVFEVTMTPEHGVFKIDTSTGKAWKYVYCVISKLDTNRVDMSGWEEVKDSGTQFIK